MDRTSFIICTLIDFPSRRVGKTRERCTSNIASSHGDDIFATVTFDGINMTENRDTIAELCGADGSARHWFGFAKLSVIL